MCSGWYCLRETECFVCPGSIGYSADQYVGSRTLSHYVYISIKYKLHKLLWSELRPRNFHPVTSFIFNWSSYVSLPFRWCHDIGREQAANKPLLKTVFQVWIFIKFWWVEGNPLPFFKNDYYHFKSHLSAGSCILDFVLFFETSYQTCLLFPGLRPSHLKITFWYEHRLWCACLHPVKRHFCLSSEIRLGYTSISFTTWENVVDHCARNASGN